MSWPLIEKVKRQLNREIGTVYKAPGSALPVALLYPNTYSLGMSNLGFLTIYHHLNLRSDVMCERFFLPDHHDLAEYTRTNSTLFSYEHQLPLAGFSVVGAALSFELDYVNFLKMLALGKIPLPAAERDESHPLVIAGGPAATFNPEPLADFVDAFIIGEGEETVQRVIDAYQAWRAAGEAKSGLRSRLAALPGVYVPALYEVTYDSRGVISGFTPQEGAPAKIRRCWVKALDAYPAYSCILTPDTEFGSMFLVEITRGCGRHCRFCMAGYCYRKPRHRSLEQILETIKLGLPYRKKFGLVGAAVSDYPAIDELCEALMKLDVQISVASLRADSLTESLVAALARSGHKTITLAPEAGSERLRRVINKGVTEGDIIRAVKLARDHGIGNVKLYFIIGFAQERAEDIEGIVSLTVLLHDLMAADGRRAGKITLRINPFIPKPFTPFERQAMAGQKEIEQKTDYIAKQLKKYKNVELIFESPKWAMVQAALARGDRRLGPVLLAVLNGGGGIAAWKRAFSARNLSMDFFGRRTRPAGEYLPWQHLDMGMDPAYLAAEAEKAGREEPTPPCPSGPCLRCGVCATGG
mgnify:FL=1